MMILISCRALNTFKALHENGVMHNGACLLSAPALFDAHEVFSGIKMHNT